jgi:hypothetical protein
MKRIKSAIAACIGPAIAITLFAAIIIIVPKACTRPDHATRVLEQAGYSNITITGWRPFMAGKDEAISTGFEATSPTGQRVSGAVTGAWLKGSTIRFD